jgi:hypothetical protein
LSNQQDDSRITRTGNFRKEDVTGIMQMPALAGAEKSVIPVNGTMRMLLYTAENGDVKINVKSFNSRGEFITYALSTPGGEPVQSGAMFEGKTISFKGEKGKAYILDIPSRGAIMKLDVDGAAVAYKANMQDAAFQLAAGKIMDGPATCWFYVPAGVKDFNVTLGTKGAKAEIFAPNGQKAGKLDCTSSLVSRLDFKENGSRAGFWKIVVDKFGGSTVSLTLDEDLPQWLITDPGRPVMMSSKQ